MSSRCLDLVPVWKKYETSCNTVDLGKTQGCKSVAPSELTQQSVRATFSHFLNWRFLLRGRFEYQDKKKKYDGTALYNIKRRMKNLREKGYWMPNGLF